MRTLVISDLHLGSIRERDVLRHRAALEPLRELVAGVDRLVLLGDVVELAEGRPRQALATAREPLATLAAALGRGREIVVVPGNHDHALVRPFLRSLRAGGRRLGLATRVPATSSPALSELASALRPARVRVHYPGAWLAPGVYAHHGHYADRHLLPRARGVLARGPLAPVPEAGATPGDYERGRPPADGRASGLELGEALEAVSGVVRGATGLALPYAGRLLRTEAVAPRSAAALGWQFRRAGLPAMAAVIEGIGIRARHVIFGHLHRAGPLDGDDPDEWTARGGRTRLHNTGSWVHEPLLLTGVVAPHPYWPGGAVLLEDGEPPRTIRLLDGVDAADMV